MNSDIIKILPNIYISNKLNTISSDIISDNNITTIINVDIIENENENEIEIKKISLNGVINFTNTNHILLEIIKKNNSCLIISNNNYIGFLIVCAFMITNLNISIIDSLYLSKKYNIDINNTNSKYIEDLFDLYKNISK